jgi:UDP-GlcNAc:undecaprenyl-phosphate GlcNAc-1-phosphate transferase
MTVPVIAFSLPIIDTCLAIVRRFLRHRPIFGADRGHIHHRLLDFGLCPRRAVLVLYACCAFAATLSLIQARFASHLGGAAVVVFCIAATAGIQRLSFAEFRIFGQMVSRGVFREQINAQVSLLRLAEALEHAEHPEECWPLVRDTCREFGFSDVHLSLGGSTFQDADLAPASQNWSVRIPLSHGSDFVQLQSGFNNNAPETVVSLASFLRRHLGAKVSRVPNELQTLSAGD